MSVNYKELDASEWCNNDFAQDEPICPLDGFECHASGCSWRTSGLCKENSDNLECELCGETKPDVHLEHIGDRHVLTLGCDACLSRCT